MTRNQLAVCFSKVYCKWMKELCLGKDASATELLLKKLYIAYWIGCKDESCDVSCFTFKHCNNC